MSSLERIKQPIHTELQLVELLDRRAPQFVRAVSDDHALLRVIGNETVAARAPMCGILAGVVASELGDKGIPTDVLIRDLDRLSTRQKHHVLAVSSLEDREMIIDLTYAQFFTDFGLNYLQLYGHQDAEGLYPDELYIAFDSVDTSVVADWMAQLVTNYWQRLGYCESMQKAYNYQVNDDGWGAPTRLMRRPSYLEIQNYFIELWDLSRYRPHAFSEEMQRDIKRIHATAV